MKKLSALFLFAVIILGCDDGDLKAVSFDFRPENVKDCNKESNKFYLYNTADKRVFILKIDENRFTKNITTGDPLALDVGTEAKVFYREYTNPVDSKTICSTDGIPSANNPLVIEWEALGGKVLITTGVTQTEENATTGATNITGYKYRITFSNIAFATGNGEQRNDFIDFGTYNLPTLSLTNFGTNEVKKCASKEDLYYSYFGAQSLELTINPDLLDTTKLGVKTEAMDGEKNILTYTTYRNTTASPLTDALFCDTTPPQNAPVLDEEYVSIVGGEVEVTTSALASKFKHVIKLKNVILKKSGSEVRFKLGFNYTFGEYTTN
jgi:hypothetical protein